MGKFGSVKKPEKLVKKHFQNSILSLTNQTLNNSVRLACGDYESKRRLGSGFGLLFREKHSDQFLTTSDERTENQKKMEI